MAAGVDVNIDDVMGRVKELTGENQLLRDTVKRNSDLMKQQFFLLESLNTRRSEERKDLMKRHEQAKLIVSNLQAALKEKETTIENIMTQLESIQENQSVSCTDELTSEMAPGVQDEITMLRGVIADNSEEMKKLQHAKTHAESERDKFNELLCKSRDKGHNAEREKRELQDQNQKLKSQLEDALNAIKKDSEEDSREGRRSGHNAIGEFLQKMQNDRSELNDLTLKLQDKEIQVRDLQRKLDNTTAEFRQSQSQWSSTMSKQKKYVDELKSQINQQQPRPEEAQNADAGSQNAGGTEDNQFLKEHVKSLIEECRRKEAQLEEINKANQQCLNRIQVMERSYEEKNQELTSLRSKDDALLSALQSSVNQCKHQLGIKTNQCRELQEALDKERQSRGFGCSASQERDFRQKIDNLMAQIYAAEDVVGEKDKMIHRLSDENNKLKSSLEEAQSNLDMVEALKAQAEVFKADFDAEREARERQVTEKEKLIEEVHRLHLQLQQLQEDQQAYSQETFAQIRQRHGLLALNRQPQEEQAAGGFDRFQAEDHRYQNMRGGVQIGWPPEEEGEENVYMTINAPPQPLNNEPEPEERQWICPKCQEELPDMDSLQLHVNRCLDDD